MEEALFQKILKQLDELEKVGWELDAATEADRQLIPPKKIPLTLRRDAGAEFKQLLYGCTEETPRRMAQEMALKEFLGESFDIGGEQILEQAKEADEEFLVALAVNAKFSSVQEFPATATFSAEKLFEELTEKIATAMFVAQIPDDRAPELSAMMDIMPRKVTLEQMPAERDCDFICRCLKALTDYTDMLHIWAETTVL